MVTFGCTSLVTHHMMAAPRVMQCNLDNVVNELLFKYKCYPRDRGHVWSVGGGPVPVCHVLLYSYLLYSMTTMFW